MNFLNRVYENFNTIDTNLRKVSPIKVIKFSDSECKKRKFFVEKSLLFDMYLRSASSYKINKNKINGSSLIPIDIKRLEIVISDSENSAKSFNNTDDIYATHDSFVAVTNDEKHIFYVVRYMKNNLFYGMLGFTLLTCGLACRKFLMKK